MTVLEEEVYVRINSNNVKHYKEKGYSFPKNENGSINMAEEILINVYDLKESSSVRVTKVCDLCGELIPNIKYGSVIKYRNLGDGLDRCKKCYNKKSAETRRQNYIKKNGSISENQPEFAKLLWNQDDALKYSYNSDVRVDFRCPRCDCRIKNKLISSIYNSGLSCSRCSDGKSYPEKFISEILNQLNVDFESQRKFKWSENKIYDFYIESMNLIIEVNGKQHYVGGFECYGKNSRNAKEEKENDILKKHNAFKNNINTYIVIDASESTVEYIKKSVMMSEMNELFDMSIIDWLKCHEYACGTLIRTACDLWNIGYGTTGQIGKALNVSCNTIALYLRQGKEIGWCKYDPVESKRMASIGGKKFTRKIIKLSVEGDFLFEYESLRAASSDIGITTGGIIATCKGKQITAGGFKWMYKDDYESYIEREIIKQKEVVNG